eukprot:1769170-Pleurochrysis_carterae.AAC.1
MERMKRNKRHAVRPLVNACSGICWIVITWFIRMGKGRAGTEQDEHRKNKGGTKASRRAIRKIQQRKLIQQRIRRWNKTRK